MWWQETSSVGGYELRSVQYFHIFPVWIYKSKVDDMQGNS